MMKASIRDLRYRFTEVERRLLDGEEIEVTRRKKVIARLVPVRPGGDFRPPDFLERLKQMYGKKVLKVSGAELLSRERDRS